MKLTLQYLFRTIAFALLLAPGLSHAQATLTPDMQRGLAWLQTQVQASGDVNAPAPPAIILARPTQTQSEVVLTLKALTNVVPTAVNTSLQAVREPGTETLARQVLAAGVTGGNVDAALSTLASFQNADGGFGGAAGYTSNALDTAYALQALHAKPSQYASAAQAGLDYLAKATPAGPDPVLGVNEQNHVFAAANMMLAANAWRGQFSAAAVSTLAKTWLLTQRNAQNNFAASHLDATALLALLNDTRDAAVIDPLLAALKAAQLADGSWAGDAYVTALALRALLVSSLPIPPASTGGLQGTVIDEATGALLADVSLLVLEDSNLSATTAAAGAFSISNLSPGNYTLRLSKLGYQSRDVSFAAVAGQIINLGSVTLRASPLSATLTGVVRDATGAPLQNALVGFGTIYVYTDANGAYTLTGVPPGPATITAALTVPGTIAANPIVYQATSVALNFELGKTYVFSPTLYLAGVTLPSTSVQGVVVDSVTKQAVSGVTVTLGALSTTTAIDGKFVFNNVSAAAYSLNLAANNYTSSAIAIGVGNGLNDLGRIELIKVKVTSTLSGIIRDAVTKLPITGATVAVQGLAANATSGIDGSYVLPGINGTALALTVTANGYATRRLTVTLTQVGASTLDVDLAKPTASTISFDSVLTKKPVYNPDELVTLELEVRSNDSKAIALLIEADVLDAQNRVVFTYLANSSTAWAGTRTPNLPLAIAANSRTQVVMDWFMLRQAAGPYRIRARGIDGNGLVVAEGETTFTVNATAVLRGGVTPNPPLTQAGTNQPVVITADLLNGGNATIPAGNLDVKITLDAVDSQAAESPQVTSRLFTSGLPMSQSSRLITDAAGNFYTINSRDYKILKTDSAGLISVVATVPPQYQSSGPFDLALAPNGDLWVTSGAGGTLLRLDASGAFTAVTYTALTSLRGIDVAANGDLVMVGEYRGPSNNYGTENRLVRMTQAGVETVLWANGLAVTVAFVADDAGNLVVSNYGDNTLSKISLASGQITPFASGLNRPQGITRDAAGNFYVANSGTDSIVKVTPAGVVSTYASGLSGPYDLRFDAAGNLFVSNQTDNSIAKVLPDGTVTRFAQGIADGPRGMKYDNAGNLWITNTDGSLRKKDTADRVSVVATGFSNPSGLAFNSANQLFIANSGAGTVETLVGGVRTPFASALKSPWGVAVDGADNVWVTENGANSIKKFAPNGSLLNTIESVLQNPTQVVPGVNGELYVRNYRFITVLENGVPRILFRSAGYDIDRIAVDPIAGGLVFTSGYEVYRLSAAGVATRITTTTLPFYPSDIGVDATGAIVLADDSAKTVQRLSGGNISPLAVLPERFATLLVDSSGRINVKAYSNALYRVQPDGTFSLIVTSGIPTPINNAFIGADGKILASTASGLYEIDRSTGNGAVVSGNTFEFVTDLTRDRSGRLHAVFSYYEQLISCDANGVKQGLISAFGAPKDIVWTGSDFRFTDSRSRIYTLSPSGYPVQVSAGLTADFLAFQAGNLYGAAYASVYRWTGAAFETYASLSPNTFVGSGIASNGTSLAVADQVGSRVVVLDAAKAITADYAGLNTPRGLTFDSAGNLYVASHGSGTIVRLDPAGKAPTLFASINTPHFLAFDAQNTLWVTTSTGSTQLDATGTPIASIAQSPGLDGIGFVGGIGYAVNAGVSIVSKLESGTWKPIASGIADTVAVRISPKDEIFVANRTNGTVSMYANGKLSNVVAGVGTILAIDLAADGTLYIGGNSGYLYSLTPNVGLGEIRVASFLDFKTLNGLAVAINGRLYVSTSVYDTTIQNYVDNIFELTIQQAVSSGVSGTVVYTGTAPMPALLADGRYASVNVGTWVPPYGGDFRIEVSRAGIAGSAVNYLHVGPFASSTLAAAKSELPPGDQSLAMCMKLDGADFTTLSRAEISQIKPIAFINQPAGMAGDRAGNVYYTDATTLYRVGQGQTNGIALANGMNLAFGLVADTNENFYVASKNAGSGNFELLKITTTGVKSVLADLGVKQANGVQVDSKGNVLVGTPGRLLKVTPAGQVSTVSTTGIDKPIGIAIDGRDNVYVQNEGSVITRIRADGSVFELYSRNDGQADPIMEGDGAPTIAGDCGESLYIAPTNWKKFNSIGEEHLIVQHNSRTNKVALLIDAITINPILQDIDYLSYDRLNNRILFWYHYFAAGVWSIPVTCGGIGVQSHLIAQAGQKLTGMSKAPAAIIPLADGRTEYVWNFKEVTVAGEQICFDSTQSGLKLGEQRKVLDSGFITLKNTFAPGDINVPLTIPTLQVSNLVSLSVVADKGDYAANTTATVTSALKNANTRTITGTLTVQVFDDKGALVGSVTQQGVSIPANGELPVQAPFQIGRIAPAQYTVKALLTDGGIDLARAQSNFNVLPDNLSASAASDVNTDRRSYNASDRVVIASRASSQSANVVLDNLTLLVRVYDPSNTLVLTYGHAIAQLLPGAQRSFAIGQALSNAPAGSYTVKQELQDAQGRALDTQVTRYQVGTSADSGFGLTGSIAASPKPVRTGESLSLAATAINAGNAALTNLPLKVVIVDPSAGTLIAEYPTTASSIGIGGSFTLPATTWVATGPTGGANSATYLAVLVATIGSGATANQLTLATDSFTLLPQIAQTITATAGTPQATLITQAYASVLEVTVRDTAGNPFPNAVVTFTAPASGASVSFASGNVISTDAQGRASVAVSANGTAGAFTVTATTPNVATVASFALTNQAAGAAKIAVQSGTPQVGLVTKPYAAALSAVVSNALGQPVVGALVSFTAPTGAGQASVSFPAGNTASTDANGVATVSITANAFAGKFQVTASTSGVAGAALFDLTNRPAVAAVLELASGTPQSATINQAYAQPLVVRVKDELGAPMRGVLVTFTLPPVANGLANVSLTTPATLVTDASGLASVRVTANAATGLASVSVTADGVSGSVSFALTNTAPALGTIGPGGGTPQSAPINTKFSDPLIATVLDSQGKPLAGVVVTFTVTASTGGAGLTFPNGNTAITGPNGQASVIGQANGITGSYTVTATAPNTSAGTRFALTNGPATAACAAPAAFQFARKAGVAQQAWITSDSMVVSGMGAGCTAIANVSNAWLRVSRNGVDITKLSPAVPNPHYTQAPTPVQDGDVITLQLFSSTQLATESQATLTLSPSDATVPARAADWFVRTRDTAATQDTEVPVNATAMLALLSLLLAACGAGLAQRHRKAVQGKRTRSLK